MLSGTSITGFIHAKMPFGISEERFLDAMVVRKKFEKILAPGILCTIAF